MISSAVWPSSLASSANYYNTRTYVCQHLCVEKFRFLINPPPSLSRRPLQPGILWIKRLSLAVIQTVLWRDAAKNNANSKARSWPVIVAAFLIQAGSRSSTTQMWYLFLYWLDIYLLGFVDGTTIASCGDDILLRNSNHRTLSHCVHACSYDSAKILVI